MPYLTKFQRNFNDGFAGGTLALLFIILLRHHTRRVYVPAFRFEFFRARHSGI